MEETIDILVENFNIKELKYEFGKQDITKLTIPSLKEILKELSFGKDVLIPPRIITDKLIIEKPDEDMYFFKNNYNFSFFKGIKESKYEKKFGYRFKLEELEGLFKKREESSKLKKVSLFFQRIVNKLWFFLIFFNIFFLITLLTLVLNNSNVNIIFIIFWIWINIFCIYSFCYGINTLIKLKKEPQRIKLEYSIPFFNSFETMDVSETIIVFGQLFLAGFNLILVERGIFIDISIIFLICIILGGILYIFIDNYTFNSESKDLILQRLLDIVHHDLEGDEKQYFLQVAIKLKEKPLLSSEKIPKFFTLFSILLTFIPVITYLFIYH